jgi:hypothetical protein
MNNIELRRQIIVAKAHLDNVKLMYEHGSATKEDVDAQRLIWDGLMNFIPGEKILKIANVSDNLDRRKGLNLDYVVVDDVIPESEELLEIQKELAEIDNLKAIATNELQKADRSKNQKDLVQKVKALRKQYLEKSDEIYYFKRHGVKFEKEAENDNFDSGTFLSTLSRDKVRLFQDIKNKESSLSKFKTRLRDAKSDVKKAHQMKNISKTEI